MQNLFYFLVSLQILVGLYLIWQAMQWLGYVRRRLLTDPGFYAPRIALFCPCKGMEPGLERNLVALTEFDHQNYEIFFVLASESDPAYGVVKRVAANSKPKANVIIAGAPEGCGEKVHNLIAAIEQLPEGFDIFVFADSDGRPGKTWLHHLSAPLNDSRIGATTTMRWLIPNSNNLPTALLAAWNAPLVTMLTEKGKNFCWGGGTAIRRSLFEDLDVLADWKNSVSDDYTLTRVLAHAGRSIVFVPECLTLSFVETDFAGLMEFTNRQILITRVYSDKMWAIAGATHLLYCLTTLLGVMVTLGNIFQQLPAFHLATLTFLPILLSAIRGAIRMMGVTEALPGWRRQISSLGWIYVLLTLCIPVLYVINFVASLISRKIRWRGVHYELISPHQTRILER